MIIVIEGNDGSGKTTLANTLVNHYKGVYKHLPTKEGIKTASEFLDDIRVAYAEMKEHPDTLYVVDRWWLSTIAYQGFGGQSMQVINRFKHTMESHQIDASDIYPFPDVTFYLEVNPLTALKRVRERGNRDRNDLTQVNSYFGRVWYGYRWLLQYMADKPLLPHTLDASKPSPEVYLDAVKILDVWL